MLFLFGKKSNKIKKNKSERNNDANTLKNERTENINVKMASPQLCHFSGQKEKAPYTTYLFGSITVEASILLPIVIATFLSLVQIMTLINIQVKVQSSLSRQVIKAAGYTYFTNYADDVFWEGMDREDILLAKNIAMNGITQLVLLNMVNQDLGDEFFKSGFISGGRDGLKLDFSLPSGDDKVDVVIKYNIRLIYNVFGIGEIPVLAKGRIREWVGKSKITRQNDNKEDAGNIVYVTKAGTVYHLSKECTYLKINLSKVKKDDIEKIKNKSGSKYFECSYFKNRGTALE